MTDPRFTKLAQLLVNYSLELEKGEKVLLDMIDVPDEFTVELIRAAREAGAVPLVEVLVLVRQHAIGGTEQHRQLRIDQLDLGETDGNVAAQHDAFAQHVVDDVEEGRVLVAEHELSVLMTIAIAGRHR